MTDTTIFTSEIPATTDILGLELHDLSMTNPNMTPAQFNSLLHSIQDNGYYVDKPIILYKGKVVDGRHRLRACKELELTTIPALTIHNNTKMEDVAAYVVSSDSRRNLQASQLAVKAVRFKHVNIGDKRLTMRVLAAMFGASTAEISAAQNLPKLLQDAFFDHGEAWYENKRYTSVQLLRARYRLDEEARAKPPMSAAVVDVALAKLNKSIARDLYLVLASKCKSINPEEMFAHQDGILELLKEDLEIDRSIWREAEAKRIAKEEK